MSIHDAVEAQIRQSQKMEAIGRLAGGIAHDFNNLLTVILTYCDFISSDSDTSEEGRENATQIKIAAERAVSLTRQLLAFSRQQILQLTVLDLNELVAGMQHLLSRLIMTHVKIEIRLDDEPAWIRADKGQMEQVVLNLCINASDAMHDRGHLTIETFRNSANEVVLRISDTGEGIPDDIMPYIFDPFFTTKPRGKGTGLGLATVYGIIKQTGGRIDVTSQVGEGAIFTAVFPAAPPLENGEPEGKVADIPPAGTETILVVEDDEYLRRALQRMLEQLGYSVVAAVSGSQAVEVADTFSEEIDMVLSDVMMPDFNAAQFLGWIAEKIPKARILLMSGHTNEDVVDIYGSAQAGEIKHPFIQKPFSLLELAQKVREVLA